jgi:hypothetical protein
MMLQPQIEVIILGMHRSGTSMVSGVLNHLGVDLGKDYPGKQLSNPLGHFEDGDFLILNETILQETGGDWRNPPPGEAILARKESFQTQIQELIKARSEKNYKRLWGWKDPRTSLTIIHYLPYLKNPHFVWCQRNPQEIARSLNNRNGMEIDEGLILANEYHQRLDSFFQDHTDLPLLIIEYAKVLSDPPLWVDKICDFLRIIPTDRQREQAINFILPDELMQKKKKQIQVKQIIMLPLRALRRLLNYLTVDQ